MRLIIKEYRVLRKIGKKNLLCILAAILTIAAYILIDGLGMISKGILFISEGTAIRNNASSGSAGDLQQTAGVYGLMKEVYIARLVILFFVLFPIVFLAY